MKKNKHFIALSVALCLSSFLNAQIKQGTSMAGGSVSFSSQKTEASSGAPQKNSSFSISPVFGKAIRDNLILGASLNFSNTSYKANHNATSSIDNTYGGGIFLRPYKPLGNSGFYLYLDSRIGADLVNGENKSNGIIINKSKGFDVALTLNPGISFAVTPGMQIETGIGNLFNAAYSSRKRTTGQTSQLDNKTSGFSAGIGLGSTLQWTVGVKFFWGS